MSELLALRDPGQDAFTLHVFRRDLGNGVHEVMWARCTEHEALRVTELRRRFDSARSDQAQLVAAAHVHRRRPRMESRADQNMPQGDTQSDSRAERCADLDRMIQFFRYAHLPPALQATSKLFAMLACDLVENLPSNPERTVALRKLLEAKDCAVRAVLFR